MSDSIGHECLVHYTQQHIQVRKDFFDICAYDKNKFNLRVNEKGKVIHDEPNQECMAKILRVMETLTDDKRKAWEVDKINAQKKGYVYPEEAPDFYLELSYGGISKLLFQTYGESTIRNCVAVLLSFLYISRIQETVNSVPKYQFHYERIQPLLKLHYDNEQKKRQLKAQWGVENKGVGVENNSQGVENKGLAVENNTNYIYYNTLFNNLSNKERDTAIETNNNTPQPNSSLDSLGPLSNLEMIKQLLATLSQEEIASLSLPSNQEPTTPYPDNVLSLEERREKGSAQKEKKDLQASGIRIVDTDIPIQSSLLDEIGEKSVDNDNGVVYSDKGKRGRRTKEQIAVDLAEKIAKNLPPEVPSLTAEWNAETAVMVVEAKIGKHYAPVMRQKQLGFANRMFKEDKDVTREQFEKAYDDRNDEWWIERNGSLHLQNLVEKDRLHTILSKLESRKGKKPSGPTNQKAPSTPATNSSEIGGSIATFLRLKDIPEDQLTEDQIVELIHSDFIACKAGM